jgi:hypothetical protein
MPQLWVTYSELADFLGIDHHDVVPACVARGLMRLVSMKGEAVVELTGEMAIAFMKGIPEVRDAVLHEAHEHRFPLRDIDETALLAAVEAGGPDYVAGEFSDLLVSRLRSVQSIAGARLAEAS